MDLFNFRFHVEVLSWKDSKEGSMLQSEGREREEKILNYIIILKILIASWLKF